MKSTLLSIVNAKGGVGKTTVTSNLGAALSKLKKRILIVDLDPQANATSLLIPGELPAKIHSFYEYLEGEEIDNCVYPTWEENMRCVPNTIETNNLEPKIIQKQKFNVIQHLKTYINGKYDFCLCDCPSNMSTWVLCALLASDFVIVPTLANSTFSIDGLLKAINLIEELRESKNKKLQFLRLLINQVDKRKAISKFNINQLKKHFPKNKIFETTIPTNTPFENAESNKQTIFQEAPASNGCKAYRSLAKEFLDIIDNERKYNE